MSETVKFPTLLTAPDVAQVLGVPTSTVYGWALRGEGPPSFKVGKHRRFDAAAVAEWLREQQEACR